MRSLLIRSLTRPRFAVVLLGVVAASTAWVHSEAKAADQIATSDRGPRPVRKRRAPYVGASIRPRATLLARGFVPGVRIAYEAGAAVTNRFALGVDLGVTAHMGLSKPSFGADVVATRYWDSYPRRRRGDGESLGAWVLAAAVGVDSHTPARAETQQRPGVGGRAGFGHAFSVNKRGEVALRADYDFRVRTDGLPVHAVFVGLGMRIHVRKK